MKITSNWLKEHLDTKLDESQIIEKLTDVGLEVESVEKQSGEFDDFIVAKILKAEKHPNADKLKVCDVDVGKENPVKVVCGAPNAIEGLLTIYAPPGSVIPKNLTLNFEIITFHNLQYCLPGLSIISSIYFRGDFHLYFDVLKLFV